MNSRAADLTKSHQKACSVFLFKILILLAESCYALDFSKPGLAPTSSREEQVNDLSHW